MAGGVHVEKEEYPGYLRKEWVGLDGSEETELKSYCG